MFAMTYDSVRDRIILFGGTHRTADGKSFEAEYDTWEFDGTSWQQVSPTSAGPQLSFPQLAYDVARNQVVLIGADSTLATKMFIYDPAAKTWNAPSPAPDLTRPSPRSLASFRTDPKTNTAWLFGGLSEFGTFYLDDFDPSNNAQRRFWAYKNGFWYPLGFANAPTECNGPLSSYDVDRSKLVVFCSGSSEIFEFDGTAWSTPTPKHTPTARRLAAMVYDENIKKTVLFGGFDETNYRQDTWTWDGTDWTEVKKNRPPNRSSMAMWYDPLAHKTIFYSGLGRGSIDERITRYSDMYSFDGNGWTKLNVSNTPGERFGAQIAIDPRTGKLLLFGGLHSVLDTATDNRTQFYDNDTWSWDGASNSWTKLNPTVSPYARQNGAMAFDPVRQEIVLFGGYAGFYYSDTWVWNGTSWTPRLDAPLRHRSAPAHEPVGPTLLDDPGVGH